MNGVDANDIVWVILAELVDIEFFGVVIDIGDVLFGYDAGGSIADEVTVAEGGFFFPEEVVVKDGLIFAGFGLGISHIVKII